MGFRSLGGVWGIAAVVVGVALLFGCTQAETPMPAASLAPATVSGQLARGEPIYSGSCATSSCHGDQGEGIRSGGGFSSWPLVGPDFQARHPNAQVVFDVVRSGDEPSLRALTDQQIYDSIAYELSQNRISLQAPLTAENASSTRGGAMSGDVQGGLFPPPEGVVLAPMPAARSLPVAADNGRLRLQVDQLAQAGAIGGERPPEGGAFLVVVFVLSDLARSPIEVGPDALRLSTPSGEMLPPRSVDVRAAVARFHKQTIAPEHSAAALVVFALPAPDQFDSLIYDDPAGAQLILSLKP